MKNTVFILGATLTISILAGCATADTAAIMRDGEKLESTFKGNKPAVLRDMGQPSRRTPILKGSGECFDYQRLINNKPMPFHVGFNRKGEVIGAGYEDTCADAIANGDLTSESPMASQK